VVQRAGEHPDTDVRASNTRTCGNFLRRYNSPSLPNQCVRPVKRMKHCPPTGDHDLRRLLLRRSKGDGEKKCGQGHEGERDGRNPELGLDLVVGNAQGDGIGQDGR
jgi:hypothetical protein